MYSPLKDVFHFTADAAVPPYRVCRDSCNGKIKGRIEKTIRDRGRERNSPWGKDEIADAGDAADARTDFSPQACRPGKKQ